MPEVAKQDTEKNSEFDALLKDLEALNKKNEDGEKQNDAVDDDPDESKPTSKDTDATNNKDDDEESLGKALNVTLPNGESASVVEATRLLKSLRSGMDQLVQERSEFAKSLNVLTEKIEQQGQVIQALGEQVIRLAKSGAGRKSVMDDGGFRKSEPMDLTGQALLQKCEAAMFAGKLSGFELSAAETYINRGQPLPYEILSKLK